MNARKAGCFGLLASIGLGACAESENETTTSGEALYSQPIADGNSFACATCHALSEPGADDLRRPGHPIGGAPKRPSFKNGQLARFDEAVDSCLREWMNADPWGPGDRRLSALSEYLNQHGDEQGSEPIEFQIVAPPRELSGGEAAAGRELFNRTCSVCHGDDGEGSVRAPQVGGLGLDAELVASRVRTSGRRDSAIYEDLTGGIMPFWSAERLSDGELLDLIAWLAEGDTATQGAGGAGGGGNATSATTSAGPTRDCDASHPRVGQVAMLKTLFHRVSGTATIVDDCTIVIDEFSYDGTGIDVRVYGGLNGNYDAGFAMTEDLLKPGGYNGETLTATLPEGRTLDELDGISVWCVAVGADFGSGSFAPGN